MTRNHNTTDDSTMKEAVKVYHGLPRRPHGSPPNPKRDEIRAAYLAGERQYHIAARLGVSEKAVQWNTQDLPRNHIAAKGELMRIGALGIKTGLTTPQKRKLEAMAKKWGCKSLSEAAMEIVRDYLEEME